MNYWCLFQAYTHLNLNIYHKDFKVFIKKWNKKENLIFVTHYVVIDELLNYAPSSGEIVIADKNLNIVDTVEIEY